jgi:hypothetical protein
MSDTIKPTKEQLASEVEKSNENEAVKILNIELAELALMVEEGEAALKEFDLRKVETKVAEAHPRFAKEEDVLGRLNEEEVEEKLILMAMERLAKLKESAS